MVYVYKVTMLFIEWICLLSLENTDKTVKIFDNAAFLRSHFSKVYIYCKLETFLLLTKSHLSIVYVSFFFIISLNIGQKTRY